MGGTKLPGENTKLPSHLGLSSMPNLVSYCNRKQRNLSAATGSRTWSPLSTSPQLHRTNNTDITAARLIKILIYSLSAQMTTTLATEASKATAPPYPTSLFGQANMHMQTCAHAHTRTCPLAQTLSEQGHCTSSPMPPKRQTLSVVDRRRIEQACTHTASTSTKQFSPVTAFPPLTHKNRIFPDN